jgi:hypothetical protein
MIYQILRIINNIFKATLVEKLSRINVYKALAVPFVDMEAKFGPLEKGIKTIDLNRDESFRMNSRLYPF